MILSLMLALTTPTATPAPTEAAPPAPQPAPAAVPTANPEDQRRICRNTQATGTRLGGRRICRTAAEWRRSQSNTREEVQDMQRDSQTSVSASPAGG
jgi:hypothetical protein